MSPEQLAAYEQRWTRHIQSQIDEFKPDIIHSHHLWLMSSLVVKLAGDIPVVVHSHATGLRQMSLCPVLGRSIQERMGGISTVLALHPGHAELIRGYYPTASVHVVGAGFRDDIFALTERVSRERYQILYAGKLSNSKGLPWLLQAMDRLNKTCPEAVLVVAGSGVGKEAEALEFQMAQRPSVEFIGRLSQAELATRMGQSSVLVLPSFYEGLPLVLIEALACGCRLVTTELEAVKTTMADALAGAIESVPMPRLESVDQPVAEDQALFVRQLADSMERSLALGAVGLDAKHMVRGFTWGGVYRRVEAVWHDLHRSG